MDVSIIVPVYNEEESLDKLFEWIERVLSQHNFDYEVVFIDDGSTDTSWQVIQALASANKTVKGIRFQSNFGKSAALNTGFKYSKGKVVITMDADLQDSPDEIPALYNMIEKEGYDMVSGWKKKRHDPINKTLPSKLFNKTTAIVTGIPLHDFNCGLKAYSHRVVKTIEVYGEMHRYIPAIAKWAGFKKIGEKVVQHYPRKYGKTKFGMERYLKGYLDLLSITFVGRYGKRPMHFFGFWGTLMFFIGFGIAIYLSYAKLFLDAYHMTERPLFYFGLFAMILGVQLFLAGFLGELLSRTAPDKNKYNIAEVVGDTKKD